MLLRKLLRELLRELLYELLREMAHWARKKQSFTTRPHLALSHARAAAAHRATARRAALLLGVQLRAQRHDGRVRAALVARLDVEADELGDDVGLLLAALDGAL